MDFDTVEGSNLHRQASSVVVAEFASDVIEPQIGHREARIGVPKVDSLRLAGAKGGITVLRTGNGQTSSAALELNSAIDVVAVNERFDARNARALVSVS